ncbi:MAG: hypothetical protein AAF805_12645, partial [Planctomycetota bacterium]
MDFVNQTIAQVRGLFESMTPGARVTAGLLLAVVVVSLGFLFQQATAGPDEYLFGGDPLGRTQIARIESALAQADIDYTVEGARIRVPRTQRNAAVAAVAAAGELPRDFNDPMKEALDGGSLFEFRDQKLQRLRNGRAQEASAVLTGHKWIEVAHVTFNEQRETGLRGRRTASAAVSIQPAVGESLTKLRLRSVKQYVSRSLVVPMENIAVTNLGDDLMAEYGVGGEVDPEEFENPFYRTKARFERDLRGKILEQVSYIPGVRVQVNAQLEET